MKGSQAGCWRASYWIIWDGLCRSGLFKEILRCGAGIHLGQLLRAGGILKLRQVKSLKYFWNDIFTNSYQKLELWRTGTFLMCGAFWSVESEIRHFGILCILNFEKLKNGTIEAARIYVAKNMFVLNADLFTNIFHPKFIIFLRVLACLWHM